jgi:hypothetical protein
MNARAAAALLIALSLGMFPSCGDEEAGPTSTTTTTSTTASDDPVDETTAPSAPTTSSVPPTTATPTTTPPAATAVPIGDGDLSTPCDEGPPSGNGLYYAAGLVPAGREIVNVCRPPDGSTVLFYATYLTDLGAFDNDLEASVLDQELNPTATFDLTALTNDAVEAVTSSPEIQAAEDIGIIAPQSVAMRADGIFVLDLGYGAIGIRLP